MKDSKIQYIDNTNIYEISIQHRLDSNRIKIKTYVDFDRERLEVSPLYLGASEVHNVFTLEGRKKLILKNIFGDDIYADMPDDVKIKMFLGKELEHSACKLLAEYEGIKSIILNKYEENGSDKYCFLSTDNRELGATLDGFVEWNDRSLSLLEIKTSSNYQLEKQANEYITKGTINIDTQFAKYYSQVQLGMHLADLESSVLFIVYFYGKHQLVEIKKDEEYIKKLLEFYDLYISDIALYRNTERDVFIENYSKSNKSLESYSFSRDIMPIDNELIDLLPLKENIDEMISIQEALNSKCDELRSEITRIYREGMAPVNEISVDLYKKLKKTIENGIYTYDNYYIIVNHNERFISNRIRFYRRINE